MALGRQKDSVNERNEKFDINKNEKDHKRFLENESNYICYCEEIIENDKDYNEKEENLFIINDFKIVNE